MELHLSYSRKKIIANVPDNRIIKIMRSRLDDYEPHKSEIALVRKSMLYPIGSKKLSELSIGKEKVVLLASDHTRPVPSKVIIPEMLREIREGNPNADITILIATGCHRITNSEELLEKLGEEVFQNEKISVHDSTDESEMVTIDTLPSGGDMTINRLVAEADLLVAEGFIEPHFFAGYSGGRKSVLPGIASRKTVYYNHNATFIDNKHARMGELDHNPIHKDMIYAAKRANLAYIVNVVINSDKRVIASFAGDCDLAHRAGCDFLSEMVSEDPVPADIVITTNNGYPLDQNVYQAVKGMCTAEATCKPGGVIISLSACENGIGGDAFYRTFRDNPSEEDLLCEIRKRGTDNTVEDQWQSQVLARILSKHTVILISEMPDHVIEEMHMIPAKTVEQAIALADKILGKENGTICVIPEGITMIIRPL